jgi:kinesin family protein 18/19
VRPESQNERDGNCRTVIKTIDPNIIIFDPQDLNNSNISAATFLHSGQKRGCEQRYAFDCVFDENATQSEVFEGSAKYLTEELLNGYNCSVFAYGATGL